MDEVDHVDDGLEEPEDVLVVANLCVHTGEEFAKVSILEQPGQSDKRVLKAELDVKQICWQQGKGVIHEPSVSNIIFNYKE